jgi:hypothetical protein
MKMKKRKYILLSLAIPVMAIVFLLAQTNDIPDDQLLRCARPKIITSQTNGESVTYWYRGNPSNDEGHNGLKEAKGKRTGNTRFYFEKRVGKKVQYKAKVWARQQSYKFNGQWFDIESHTIDKVWWDSQTSDWTDLFVGRAYADIVFSTTGDGYINSAPSTWATAHGAATGSSVNNTASEYASTFSSQFNGSTYFIFRGFFYFDLSALSGTVTASKIAIRGYGLGETSVSAQLGTQAATLTTADYDSFTGSEYGHSTGWSTTGYNEIVFNAQGIADTQSALGGSLNICAREYTYDYLNTPPPSTASRNGCYFSNSAGTANDPYLEVTLLTANPQTMSVN